MKTLHLKLKKNVLIVDAVSEEVANGIIIQEYGVKTLSEYKFLCKGEELTEEQCKELIYFNKNTGLYDGYYFPLIAFIEAVSEQGYNWLVNPESKSYFNPEDFIQEEYERFMECESRTLKNPYIFIKE